jgi:Tol biopolymer transport system component
VTRRDPFDRIVAQWLDAEADAPGPSERLEHILAVTERQRPRPAWMAALTGRWVGGTPRLVDDRAMALPQLARGRWQLAVVLLLALAIVGGAIVVGAFLTRPSPTLLVRPSPVERPSGLLPSPEPSLLAAPAAVTNGWIAYTVESDERDNDLYLVALDHESRRIAGSDTDHADQICPAFSPDGRRLAYGEAEGAANDHPHPDLPHGNYRNAALVIVDIDREGNSSESQRFTIGGSFPPPCATWSPDGSRIAFGIPQTSPINPDIGAAGSQVWIVTLADGSITVLPDLLATYLQWCPDGNELAIASGTDQASPGSGLADSIIRVYDVKAGKVRAVPTKTPVWYFNWSPDGRWLAYDVPDGVLRVFDLEKERDQVLGAPSEAFAGFGPLWAPRGDWFVYRREIADGSFEVYFVEINPADGDAVRTEIISTPMGEGSAPARTNFWSPGQLSWSPDGAYLLYVGLAGMPPRSGATDVVVVPMDPTATEIVVADQPGIGGDAYDAVAPLPMQSWGRQP